MAGLAMRLHVRQEGDEAVDDAAKVDAEDPVPIVEACLVHRPEHADSGIVDENVELADFALHRLARRRPGVAVGDVERDEQGRVMAIVAEPARRRLAVGFAAIAESELHAFCGQRLGDAEAEAADGAGDQGRLAGECVERFRHQATSPSSASVAACPHLSRGGIGLFSQCGSRVKLETLRPSGIFPFPPPWL